jgi:hypothetical protein
VVFSLTVTMTLLLCINRRDGDQRWIASDD